MKRLLPLMLVLGLAACSQPATDESGTAPAAAATAPAAEVAPAPPADAPAEVPAQAPADETTTPPVPADEAAAGTPAPAAPDAPTPVPAPAMPDPANAPRAGIDYTVLPEPQPTFGTGGIEVAEVFSYTCIHCANLQPTINAWKPTLPADVSFRYVPGAFGGPGDNFARGFFAAEILGLLDKTHDGVFKAFFVDRKFQTASVDEIADHYASQGADREAFLSTMNSFAVTAKLNRARQFALRTKVEATPTMIINGKYSAVTTNDRGPEGLLATIEYLVAVERAGGTP
ncbi:MAG: thiol:disulfide interchange protein DsbA/DsbL [Arenimonas sp.]|uniref:thiol:disulfide interchange protein DsbA/DsbL n=1 Tax=Arenimonas sp. TaxID=1872635 RepID=UPI0025BCF630|nr:thiol:disulfide interchange protein DsbA/DsbL [Arenimonas sp.]MBW8367896.1 thiol:disulfide interchange protein DsbA/DsbL [Arenimonas sp.]